MRSTPETTSRIHPLAIEAIRLERELHPWDQLSAAIPAWHPRNEGEGGSGDGGNGGGTGSGEGGQGGAGGSGDGGAGAGASGEQWTPPSREEFERLQKAAGTANAELRREREAREKRERENAEKDGQFKELYEKEKAEREREKAEAENERRRNQIERVANRLKFRNPEIAYATLQSRNKLDGLDSEGSIESELKKLAKSDAYLVDVGTAQRGNAGNDDEGAGQGGSGQQQNGNGSSSGDQQPPALGVDRVRNYYDKQSKT